MRLYQPMLYVGLGGTGCQIGVELERRLRDELCGPDGTALQQRVAGVQPFQLPGFTQFVYADLNEVELSRVRRQAVSGEEHAVAAAMTQHFAQNLVPRYRTYPEVARSLRTNARAETAAWLPPPAGEPRVAPLVRGAGQLPTVGRAALFETFRHGFDAVRAPLSEAIGRISKSGGLLTELGGKVGDTCNVFIGFSVAGGTGAGIYYDFLHLIGNEFRAAHISPQFYPLVLMPSAFEDGRGGGRRARLNAANSLLDLFRLIDDQNARGAANQLGDSRRPVDAAIMRASAVRYDSRLTASAEAARNTERISVTYPDLGDVQLENSILQTAFLFCRTVSVDREDLYRSIVSFILSLVGTELDAEDETERAAEQMYQSFADGFINEGVERQVPAFTGIGRRPVSTSLVASMTVPVDELADIISARILARAVEELASLPPGQTEQNRAHIEQFYASSGLDELRVRLPEAFTETPAVRGAAPITQALRVRIGTMDKRVATLPSRLRVLAPQMAREFDVRRGMREALTQLDPLRLRRVVVGSPMASEPADQLGFIGSLESRRAAPPAPPGMTATAPAVEPFRRRGLHQVEWRDPEVKRVVARQDLWYRWRTESAWNSIWGELAPVWDPKVARLRAAVNSFADAFLAHARAEPEDYETRTADLHRPRSGISYLVPARSDFEQFYNAVLRRFTGRTDLALRPNATEAEIVNALLGVDGWQHAYDLAAELATDNRYEQAVLSIRDLLKQQIKILFTDRGPFGDEQPLLPRLRDRLAQAAGKEGPTVADSDLGAFQQAVAGLLPMSYVPEGTGQLKILVAYPQPAKDPLVERYLEENLNLPKEANAHKEFRAVDTESVMVVLLRTSMGITEVPELRAILRHWSDALSREQPQDFIRWRQRLGYNYRWLATSREDRVLIMQRVLCAMWNGQVTPISDRESPNGVVVRLPGDDQPMEMVLRLDPYGRASSWANLLRAYEEWTFSDNDQIRQDFCEHLMETLPKGLSEVPELPHPLFTWFVDELAPAQERILEAMRLTVPVDSRPWVDDLLDFWANTVPMAQTVPFLATQNAVSANIAELKAHVVHSHPAARPPAYRDSGAGSGGSRGLEDGYDGALTDDRPL